MVNLKRFLMVNLTAFKCALKPQRFVWCCCWFQSVSMGTLNGFQWIPMDLNGLSWTLIGFNGTLLQVRSEGGAQQRGRRRGRGAIMVSFEQYSSWIIIIFGAISVWCRIMLREKIKRPILGTQRFPLSHYHHFIPPNDDQYCQSKELKPVIATFKWSPIISTKKWIQYFIDGSSSFCSFPEWWRESITSHHYIPPNNVIQKI